MGPLPAQAWVSAPAETAARAGEPCPEDTGTFLLGAQPAPGPSPKETTKPEWISPAPGHPDFVGSPSVQRACEHGIIRMGTVPGRSRAPSRVSHKVRAGHSGLHPG